MTGHDEEYEYIDPVNKTDVKCVNREMLERFRKKFPFSQLIADDDADLEPFIPDDDPRRQMPVPNRRVKPQ